MSNLPAGWEDVALEAANLDMSNDEAPRFFAKIIAIRTANRLAELSAARITELEAENARLREALEIARGVAQCAKAHVRIEWDGLIKEIDAAMGHSANTVGGPTPVMDAAPAWERKE